MDAVQFASGYRVSAIDGEFHPLIVEQASTQRMRVDPEVGFSQAIFYRDLPNTGGAENEPIVRVG